MPAHVMSCLSVPWKFEELPPAVNGGTILNYVFYLDWLFSDNPFSSCSIHINYFDYITLSLYFISISTILTVPHYLFIIYVCIYKIISIMSNYWKVTEVYIMVYISKNMMHRIQIFKPEMECSLCKT